MYLPDEMHRYLTREASERGVSMAEVAREAIGFYRAHRAEALQPNVSALFGAIADDLSADDLALAIDSGLAEHFAEAGTWERDNGLAPTD